LLTHLRIRAKLGLALGLLVLLLAGIAGFGAFALHRVDDAARSIRDTWLPGTRHIGQFSAHAIRFRQLHAAYLLAPDRTARQREEAGLDRTRRDLDGTWHSLRPLLLDGEAQQLAAEVEAAWQAYVAMGERMLDMAQAGDRAAATALYVGEMRAGFGRLRAALDRLADAKLDGGGDATRTAEAIYDTALLLFGLLTLLAVAVALGALAWLDRGTARPLAGLAGRMRALAAGDVESPVPGHGRGDEVGMMAEALESFRQAALERERLATAVATEQAARQARAERVERLLHGFEAELAEAMAAVTQAAGELDGTAGALRAMAGSGSERAASLAAASEQASANVQAAAASTEEMGASIAEVARQVAESARVAREAAGAAREADGTMAELAGAAQRIGEVVRLITGIAGQTNLLALNATIEAARAGDAGKGFAVVAQEVKALAAQTARATEEITAQIAAMQAESERAVAAIRGIAATVAGMDGLTAQVAAAAEEQAAAVGEIGRAVAEAAAGTTEVSRHAAGVTDGARETDAASGQVRDASGELARRAAGLRGQVDRFMAGIRAA
jgi:methyl-accepting chemotaxis protein